MKRFASSDNDDFVTKNFEMLVDKYARQWVVISHRHIFTGKNALKQARKKYPGTTPMLLPVPAREEFSSLL